MIPRPTRRGSTLLLMAAILTVAITCIVQSAHAQKFPSCTDDEAKEKTTRLLGNWYRDKGGGNSPGINLLSVQIDGINPRNARFGPYSGILECEIAFSLVVLKVATNERFVIRPPNMMAIYYGYDQSGSLTLKLPGYVEAFQ